MNIKTYFTDDNSKHSFFQRNRYFFWVISICLSVLTFFIPLLTESHDRLSMAYDMAITGYEMVFYRPVLTAFIITVPILTAMLHTADLPLEKKLRRYYGMGILFEVVFFACILLTWLELYHAEHRIAMFSGGTYIVLVANFLNLSMGVFPTIWMMEEEDDE